MNRTWGLADPAPRPGLADAGWDPPDEEAPSRAQPGWPTRVAYALSGLLVLGVLLANFNPSFGFFQQDRGYTAHRWPWEAFRGPEGVTLRWVPPHAFLLAMTLSGLALLLCAALPSGRSRAGLALTAFVLIVGMQIATPGDFLIMTGHNVAFAVLVAGVLAASARPTPVAGRQLLWAGMLAVTIFVFLPQHDAPTDDSGPMGSRIYRSTATQTIEGFAALLGDPTPLIVEGDGTTREMNLLDWVRSHLFTVPMLLGLVIAVLVLLGLGGVWAPSAMGLLLLVLVLGPAWDHAARALAEARASGKGVSSSDAFEIVARNFSEGLLTVLRIALIPLAVGLADFVRSRRQPAV